MIPYIFALLCALTIVLGTISEDKKRVSAFLMAIALALLAIFYLLADTL